MQSDAAIVPLQAGQLFSIQTWFMSHGRNNQVQGCGSKKPKYPLWSTRTLKTPASLRTIWADVAANAPDLEASITDAHARPSASSWSGNMLRCDHALAAIMNSMCSAYSTLENLKTAVQQTFNRFALHGKLAWPSGHMANAGRAYKLLMAAFGIRIPDAKAKLPSRWSEIVDTNGLLSAPDLVLVAVTIGKPILAVERAASGSWDRMSVYWDLPKVALVQSAQQSIATLDSMVAIGVKGEVAGVLVGHGTRCRVMDLGWMCDDDFTSGVAREHVHRLNSTYQVCMQRAPSK